MGGVLCANACARLGTPTPLPLAETGAGLAVRLRMVLSPGYVYAPTTELPPDLRRQREEMAAQTGWGALLSGARGQPADAGPQRFTVVRGGLSSGSGARPAMPAGAGHTLGSTAAAPAPAPSAGTGENIGPGTQRMLEDLAAKRAAAAAAADARSRAAAARVMSASDRQALAAASAQQPNNTSGSAFPAPGAVSSGGGGYDEDDDASETVNLLTMPGDAPPPAPPAARRAAPTAAASAGVAADLEAMGFDRGAVQRALQQSGGDVDRAILLLTEV